MLRRVPTGVVTKEPFDLIKFYATAFKNRQLTRIFSLVFAIGFSVFGSFAYSGYYVQALTNLPIVIVGLIVATFGIGSIASSRILLSCTRDLDCDLFLLRALSGQPPY